MSKAKLAAACIMSVLFAAAVLWFVFWVDSSSQHERMLDSKVALIEQTFDCYGDILSRSGGYDEASGVYRYEFVWYYNWRATRMLVYEETVDLTSETISLIRVRE